MSMLDTFGNTDELRMSMLTFLSSYEGIMESIGR